MYKRLIYILGLLATVSGIVVIWLYHIPQKTPVNVTLEVIKFDEHGSEIGIENISIQGNAEAYILRGEYLNVNIANFDGVSNIKTAVDVESRMPGLICDSISPQYNYVGYSAMQAEQAISLTVFFSKNYERWLILSRPAFRDEGAVYYLGSTSASDSVDDLKAFFAGIIPEK